MKNAFTNMEKNSQALTYSQKRNQGKSNKVNNIQNLIKITDIF